LEKLKFDFQKRLEERKLSLEWYKAWITGGSLLIPLLLGVITLAWQSKTTAKFKEDEAKSAFELKAADIIFEGDNPRATRNKARALAALFPNKIDKDFANAFKPEEFSGPKYESKLEVFKAAFTKVQTPDEVYRIWSEIFPGDEWIRRLVDRKVATNDP
jgi:hypothetical protein